MTRHRSSRSRYLTLSLMLALAPAPTTPGPQQPPSAEQMTFPAGTELVSVDVLVLDKQGQPVEGLTAADFTLEEDGRPQTVGSFEAVTLLESSSPPAARSRVATNEPSRDRPERSFVIVFDELNLSPLTIAVARKAVKEFLENGLEDGDLVTLVPSGGGAWWTERLPEGREALLAVTERLESRFRPDNSVARLSDFEALQIYNGRDPQILSQVLRRYYENGVLQEYDNAAEARRSTAELGISPGAQLVKARATEVYQAYSERVNRTLGIFERVAEALRQAKGRKIVLFVSEGFVHDGTKPGFREVVRAARDANAVFYFVDARGLLGPAGAPGAPGAAADQGRLVLSQDTLSTLANPRRESEGAESVALDTGGFSIRNTNNLSERMRSLARESRAYYLVGYSPTNTRRDGKFRKIEVRVSRPGADVRARRGYYAPSDKQPKALRKGELDPRLRAALDAPQAVAGIGLRLVAHGLGPIAPARSAALLVAEVDLDTVELRPGRDQTHQGVLETYVVVSSRETGENVPQEKLVELSLPPDVYAQVRASGLPLFREFQLSPGEYQARFVVRDRHSGRVGSVRHEFTVADPEVLGTSTPILTDRLQPAGPQGPARPVPVARRTFASGARLYYAFEVYGAGRDAGGALRLSSSYVIRREDGSTVTRSEPQALSAGPQGQPSQMLSLSLQGVPPGSYELLLTVRDDVAGRSIEVEEPFSVEQG
jgi:VWFA-related protein